MEPMMILVIHREDRRLGIVPADGAETARVLAHGLEKYDPAVLSAWAVPVVKGGAR